MNLNLDKLKHQALELLRAACHPQGIWASPEDRENYGRIWARDSVIAGIAGLLAKDNQVIKGLGDSIRTLAEHQHPRGMIPSNVKPDKKDPEISYGTLAGRVDANSWFIIGSCLYLANSPDGSLVRDLQPKIQKVLDLLDCWEFNGGGLLYTPLSGNWADEYPVEGYTLYDNLLRLWALRVYNNFFEDPDRQKQARRLEEKITVNFWPDLSQHDNPAVYHQRTFENLAKNDPDHFACAINPTGYKTAFDTAAHALALLLRIVSNQQLDRILNHLDNIFRQVSTSLLPAFWPIISSNDAMWGALKNNYNYNFKNYPGEYQNGGIWPVWMGLFGLGAATAGQNELPEEMLKAWMKIEDPNNISFNEYISSNTLKPGGKKPLCYSASGLIFLISAIQKKSLEKLHIS